MKVYYWKQDHENDYNTDVLTPVRSLHRDLLGVITKCVNK